MSTAKVLKKISHKLSKPQLFPLYLSVILGSFLRFFNLTRNGLWYDETFSAVMIRRPLTEIINQAQFDVHPPFYYFILKWWSFIFGEGELALKSLSILFGVTLIIAIYVLAKKLFNQKIALIASFIITVAPFFIQYSQEVRMYTLGTFLAVVSTIYLWQAIYNQSKKRTFYYWIGYIVFSILAIYTQYFLILTLVAQGVGLILSYFFTTRALKQNLFKKWWQFGLSTIIIAVSYIPWLPILLTQMNQVKEDFWIPALTVKGVIRIFFVLIFGSIETYNFWLIIIPLLGILITLGFLFFKFIKKRSLKKNALIFITSYLFVPILIAILFSFDRSIFLDRYFIFAGVGIPIILGLIISYIKSKKVLLTGMIVIAIISIIIASTDVFGKISRQEGIRELTPKLNQKYDHSKKIIHSSSFTFFIFKYYNKDRFSVVFAGDKELNHYSGNALIKEGEVIKDLDDYLKNDDDFLMIDTWDFGDPDIPPIPNRFTEKEKHQFGKETLIYYERR